MLLSQQFCVLLFDLCTARSLFSSTGLPELGRLPVPLDLMGKVDTKIREQSSILEKVSRQADKNPPGRQEEEKPTTEMEGPGGQSLPRTEPLIAQLKTIPTGSSHCTECGTSLLLPPPAQHRKKGLTALQLQTLGKGLVIPSVQVLTDWILSDRKGSSSSENF